MSLYAARRGAAGRLGELALWTGAAIFVLTAHVGGAAYMMQQAADAPSENGPPAAIMIDMAPEPEAANTEEDKVSEQVMDQEEVKSEQTEPVEEPPPEPVEEPIPEPVPEPVVDQPVEPPPPEEVAEVPEPEPEPIEEPPPVEQPDPIEEKVTAALENVEVPLPMMRPPVEKKKEEPKKPRKQQQRQAQKEMTEAKLQTKESDRTAASQTSAGTTFSSVSPSTWKSKVQARLARNARRCPGNGTGTAAVRFNFDNGGNVTGVSLSRSSGNPEIDDYIVSVVRRSSPIPAPPAGVPGYLVQALTCSR